eukprot:TRINITY_DN8677_c0_g1_i1.p1 TRINITY_DN8677_c0_g1~~TRINITY_DN8677_c0_g1_i1.p1  ORF type:complete len:766 (+),score=149.51 TRINITY_DN8677_c0_g1_i1:998-3295(+)
MHNFFMFVAIFYFWRTIYKRKEPSIPNKDEDEADFWRANLGVSRKRIKDVFMCCIFDGKTNATLHDWYHRKGVRVMYVLHDLLHDCSTTPFGRTQSAKAHLQIVWNNLLRFVEVEFSKGKIVELPKFAKFSWKLAAKPSRSLHAPFFLFADSFCTQYRLRRTTNNDEVQVPVCHIDFHRFAIQCLLPKDTVEFCYYSLVQGIGRACASGKSIQLDFGISFLTIWDGSFTMRFKPSFVQKIHPTLPQTVANPLELTSKKPICRPENIHVRPKSAETPRRSAGDNTYTLSQKYGKEAKLSRETQQKIRRQISSPSVQRNPLSKIMTPDVVRNNVNLHNPRYDEENKPVNEKTPRVKENISSYKREKGQNTIAERQTYQKENDKDKYDSTLVEKEKQLSHTDLHNDDQSTADSTRMVTTSKQGKAEEIKDGQVVFCDICATRRKQLMEKHEQLLKLERENKKYLEEMQRIDNHDQEHAREVRIQNQKIRQDIESYNRELSKIRCESKMSAHREKCQPYWPYEKSMQEREYAMKQTRQSYARELDAQIQENTKSKVATLHESQKAQSEMENEIAKCEQDLIREKDLMQKRKEAYREILQTQMSEKLSKPARDDVLEVNNFARVESDGQQRRLARTLMQEQMKYAHEKEQSRLKAQLESVEAEASELETLKRQQEQDAISTRASQLAHRKLLMDSWQGQLSRKKAFDNLAWEPSASPDPILIGVGEKDAYEDSTQRCGECKAPVYSHTSNQTSGLVSYARRRSEITMNTF